MSTKERMNQQDERQPISGLQKNRAIVPLIRSFSYQGNQFSIEHIKTSLALIGLAQSPAHLEELLEVNHHTIWDGFRGGPTRLILPLLELWAYRLTTSYFHARDLVSKLRVYCKLSKHGGSSMHSLKIPFSTLESTLHLEGSSCAELQRWNHQDMAQAVFADCISSSTLKFEEHQLGGSRTYLKVRQDILADPLFLSSLKRLRPVKSLSHGWEINPEPSITKCHRLPGCGRHYFLKQLSLAKVQHADYEISIAERVHAKGIMTPTPYGVVVCSSIPYIVFEFQEGAINIFGLDWRYKKPHRLWRALCRQEAEVYTALGKYVWTMLENGVNPRDIAKRNFVATFDSSGSFERVMGVDFEKTVITNSLESIDRTVTLEQLKQECTPSQKRYLLNGYLDHAFSNSMTPS